MDYRTKINHELVEEMGGRHSPIYKGTENKMDATCTTTRKTKHNKKKRKI